MDYIDSPAHKDRRKKVKKSKTEMTKMLSGTEGYLEQLKSQTDKKRKVVEEENAAKKRLAEMRNNEPKGIAKTLSRVGEELASGLGYSSYDPEERKKEMKKRALRKLAGKMEK